MRVSVILSTYNQPEWLRKTLWGYARQTYPDFEVLIADDGSGQETRAVIAEARERHPALPLKHIRHEDRGYRKCVILNRGVLAAEGDYLLFSDADCIPRADFVATHARLAEPGTFLSGGAVRLPRELSEALTEEDVAAGRVFDAGWLAGRGFDPGRHRLRLLEGAALPTLLDALSPTGATWNGNNASAWRSAVVRANGFEHELGYGGQDREFGERITNLGLTGKLVRHRAVAVHLDHGRPYRSEESIRGNRDARASVRRTGRARARHGIEQLESE
ncbi:MAG TPA: glycosyltransferase family 2 protein [Longimicrobiales bacterium]|nr:glycosyltransferase family 2 protein [Longimicrobiales bacterium]